MYNLPRIKLIYCSECGLKIGEDRLNDIPIGTIFALRMNGFKEDRVFCGKSEFDNFYSKHPKERSKAT